MPEDIVLEDYEGRTVVRMFPPHVRFEAQLMQKKPWSSYATLEDSMFADGVPIAAVGISGGKAYRITVDNGTAYYVCGPLEDGYREGWLWSMGQ